ncbi:MAG: NusA N-terminal domain-containing protein, partial [Patescibacteria group bacterium]
MLDLKIINSVLDQMQEERGIPREKMLEAIESALATAYKKEYGKKGQIVRAKLDPNSGKAEFSQVKIVVDDTRVKMPKEDGEEEVEEAYDPDDIRVHYNSEHHILIGDARRIKKDVELDEELVFPLEHKDDYGRIAAQTAKQVIIQKIREAEKTSVLGEYGKREGEIVVGTVQSQERGY